jgi:hypothetical protein
MSAPGRAKAVTSAMAAGTMTTGGAAGGPTFSPWTSRANSGALGSLFSFELIVCSLPSFQEHFLNFQASLANSDDTAMFAEALGTDERGTGRGRTSETSMDTPPQSPRLRAPITLQTDRLGFLLYLEKYGGSEPDSPPGLAPGALYINGSG